MTLFKHGLNSMRRQLETHLGSPVKSLNLESEKLEVGLEMAEEMSRRQTPGVRASK